MRILYESAFFKLFGHFVGTGSLKNKRVCPKAGAHPHLKVCKPLLRSKNDLHIVTPTVHTRGNMESMSAVRYGYFDCLTVADISIGLTVKINAKSTCNTERRTLAVKSYESVRIKRKRHIALGAKLTVLRIHNVATVAFYSK